MCEVFGALWLLSCLFSSLGTIDQIIRNSRRQSVLGLSLFDSEVRLYGKIPWLLFACGLRATDWWILAINGFGILLALIVLAQFQLYSTKISPLRFTFAIISLSISSVLIYNFNLSVYRDIATYSPVIISMILIPMACRSQYLKNAENACQAVTFDRYAMYFLSNLCSYVYGMAKIESYGIDLAWPIVSVAIIGLASNTIMLHQIVREGECPVFIKSIHTRLLNRRFLQSPVYATKK